MVIIFILKCNSWAGIICFFVITIFHPRFFRVYIPIASTHFYHSYSIPYLIKVQFLFLFVLLWLTGTVWQLATYYSLYFIKYNAILSHSSFFFSLLPLLALILFEQTLWVLFTWILCPLISSFYLTMDIFFVNFDIVVKIL